MHAYSRPVAARTLPLGVYAFFLLLASALGWSQQHLNLSLSDSRWLYPLKVGCVALVLFWFAKDYIELRVWPALWHVLLGLLLGALVFFAWIHLDMPWAKLGNSVGFDPRDSKGELDLGLTAFRVAGAVVVVPLMEELFWRAWLMRWLERSEFLTLDARRVGPRALCLSAVFFGMGHTLWLAGVMAGLVYGALYIATRNIWPSIVAHAMTNAMLAWWVLSRQQWSFW